MQKIALVLMNIPVKTINKAFSYLVPPNLQFIEAGWRVLVPFGSRNIEGFVISTHEGSDDGLKNIISVLDDLPWFDENTLQTAEWISDYYLCSLAEAMRLFIPGKAGLKTSSSYQLCTGRNDPATEMLLSAKPGPYLEVYHYLARHGPASLPQLHKQIAGDCLKALNYLISKNIAEKKYHTVKQDKPKYETLLTLAITADDAKQLMNAAGHRPAQQRLLAALTAREYLTREDLKQLKISRDTVKRLLEGGVIAAEQKRLVRNSYAGISCKACKVTLSRQQQQALNGMMPAVDDRRYHSFLLYGITGSGKTQVYLELVAAVRRKRRQAIVLVPEIALTSQIVARFQAMFGDDIVVLHSRLSIHERNDAVWRLRTGQAGIVIGARSAVFAPLDDLGVIIIDEEHEFTYKQEEAPRYHAREVALRRAELAEAVVVMGSATPSVETYYKAAHHIHTLLEMADRIDGARLPEVELVDMREELRRGRRSVVSSALQKLINSTLERGEQAIILLNRRGFSTFVMCRECGHVMSCGNCAVSLVYHKSGMLRCHYCQTSVAPPDVCPVCSSRYIRYFGTGTQRLEDELAKLFPQARMVRMDQDTTGGKLGHDRILQAFAQGSYDILLGTQMVAKGHDIKNVTAVGIITADSILNLPDFRAAERTFALITQAAGRAGRGTASGRVIIQTYNPEHYAIKTGSRHAYTDFYAQELELRRSLFYPPFSRIIKLTITAMDEGEVRGKAAAVAAELETALAGREGGAKILGPFVAPIAKISNTFRMHILIKAVQNDVVRQQLSRLKLNLRTDVIIDIDPVNVM